MEIQQRPAATADVAQVQPAPQPLLQHSLIVQISSDVPEYLAAAALRGVQKAVALIPESAAQFRVISLDDSGRTADSAIQEVIADDGVRKAANGLQLNSFAVAMAAYRATAGHGPAWNILLCNQDLYDWKFGWVLGLTVPFQQPITVQSTARFMNPRISDEQRELAVTRLLAHEVGHMLGLVQRTHDVVESFGLHCTNPCIMQQAPTPLRWIKLAEQERDHGIDFCACCRNELKVYWPEQEAANLSECLLPTVATPNDIG